VHVDPEGGINLGVGDLVVRVDVVRVGQVLEVDVRDRVDAPWGGTPV
jgi:hypothetical protein